MEREFKKMSARFTFSEKDHKNGVKFTFSNIKKDAPAEDIQKLGQLIDQLTAAILLDGETIETDHVAVTSQPAEPKAAEAQPEAEAPKQG